MDINKEIVKITEELQQAYEANVKGKEGLSRVCARRAAGWAIQMHLELQGLSLDTPSVLDHFTFMFKQSNTKPEIQEILRHMTQKVEKDSLENDSYWPLSEVNLIEEAHWLVEELLGISIDIEKP